MMVGIFFQCKQEWNFFGVVDDDSLELIFFMVPANFGE